MSQIKKFGNKSLYRSLLAVALLVNGFFQFVSPVLAEGTKAGTSISNTATATYEDPNDPNTTLNSTSNTVEITVAEVAGITVTGSGVSEPTDGVIQVGDTLNFDFTVTNVGNDPTKFRIPDLAKVTGPGSAGKLQVSINGAAFTDITGSELITSSIPVGGSILVRVPVAVANGAQANDVITVTLGDTPGDAQNQLRSEDGGDVYTVDNADGSETDEINGDPVNGVREASATQTATINQSLKTYALATVLKTRSNYSDNNTSADITDDTLTYDLSLRNELSDPTGNAITPAPLVGTSINLNGTTTTRILISDAIPLGTDLAEVPTAPSGWQVVYSTDAVTTNANEANWTTTAPPDLSSVTRIGFINDVNVITSIAPGQTASGFTIKLAIEGTATSPLIVNNIAQLFGKTLGDTNDILVYDESGDQNPSNYDGGTIPPGATDTNNDGVPDSSPTVTDGYIDDNTDLNATGTDSANNNTGTGGGGEANSFPIQVAVATDILNGPEGAADAIGPTDNNDDFTNKSSLVPEGTQPGTTLDPSSVAFTNTVRNSGTTVGNISLIPTPPATAADLPTNTVVTITYQSDSRTYVWNGSDFLFDTDGNVTSSGDQSAIDDATEYITIPNVAAGADVNYGVEVNLPSGTPLSTDDGVERGFPVPITAFYDDGTGGLGADATAEPRNITIDRVYTGFLKLTKESRILPGTGTAPASGDETFSSTTKTGAPGNIIEYQIKYKNISEAESGINNVILNAADVVITEDGTVSPNNWALDNDSNGSIDTSNIVGTAKDSGASTINFFSGNPATTSAQDQTGTTLTTDVTKYVDTVTGTVAPQEERTFTFQRRIN